LPLEAVVLELLIPELVLVPLVVEALLEGLDPIPLADELLLPGEPLAELRLIEIIANCTCPLVGSMMRSCTVPALWPSWPLMLWFISLLARRDLPICDVLLYEPTPVLLDVAVPLELELLPAPYWLELLAPGAPLDDRSRLEFDPETFEPDDCDDLLELVLLPLELDLSLSSFATA
jgi:hypothetical protein